MQLFAYPVFYCIAGTLLAFFLEPVRASWWGAVVLAALICLYAFMASHSKDEPVKREAGDNCYFIGFIYTLVVIAAALMLDAENLKNDPNTLLQTVGVALTTSIAGMMLRFVLSHGEVIPRDKYDEEVRKVAKAAYELSGAVGKISQTASEFHSTVEEVTDAMKKYGEKLKEHAGTITDDVKDPFFNLLQELSKQMRDVFKDDLFADAKAQLDSVVKHQKNALSAIEENLKNSTDKLNISANKTIENSENIKKAVSRLIEELKKLSDALAAVINNQQQQSNVTKEQIKVIYGAKDEVDRKIGELRARYEDLTQKATGQLYDGLIAGAEKAISDLEKNAKSK